MPIYIPDMDNSLAVRVANSPHVLAAYSTGRQAMNACLLIINPANVAEPPFAPTLILEQNDNLVLYSAGWPHLIKCGRLSELSLENLRKLPGIRAEDIILLSDIRQLPTEDLLAEELISFTRKWWLQTVTEQKPSKQTAKSMQATL